MMKPDDMLTEAEKWAGDDRRKMRDAWQMIAEICQRLDMLIEEVQAFRTDVQGKL